MVMVTSDDIDCILVVRVDIVKLFNTRSQSRSQFVAAVLVDDEVKTTGRDK